MKGFNGGQVPGNNSLANAAIIGLGVPTAFMAFGGMPKRLLATVIITILLLLVFIVVNAGGHWALGGIWWFDISAILVGIGALIIVLRNKSDDQGYV